MMNQTIQRSSIALLLFATQAHATTESVPIFVSNVIVSVLASFVAAVCAYAVWNHFLSLSTAEKIRDASHIAADRPPPLGRERSRSASASPSPSPRVSRRGLKREKLRLARDRLRPYGKNICLTWFWTVLTVTLILVALGLFADVFIINYGIYRLCMWILRMGIVNWIYVKICFFVSISISMYSLRRSLIELCSGLFSMFQHDILAYNQSWEDPRIDRRVLNAKDNVVMTFTSAGDNVLDALCDEPKKIIACDQNVAQTALLDLKMACIKVLDVEQTERLFIQLDMDFYNEIYPILRPHLRLPESASWWDKQPRDIFRNFWYKGGSGKAARLVVTISRWIFGMGPLLDTIAFCESIEEQRVVYKQFRYRVLTLFRVLDYTGILKLCCFAANVPLNQQNLIDGTLGDLAMETIDHLMTKTYLAGDNHFFACYMFGRYVNRCVPRWLQPGWYYALRERLDRVDLSLGNVFGKLDELPPGSIDCFNLLDHLDWMDEHTILMEWEKLQRVASPHARVLWKSAKANCLPVLSWIPTTDHDKIREFREIDRIPMYRGIFVGDFPHKDFVPIMTRNKPVPESTLWGDLQILYGMWMAPMMRKITGEEISKVKKNDRTADARAKMNQFYASQAGLYDSYRHRMLHARPMMMNRIPFKANTVWLDVGAGTGFNTEYVKKFIDAGIISKVYLLDVCDHLLAQARKRVEANGWAEKVETIRADITDESSLEGVKERPTVITFSYSLTMIPDWKKALAMAMKLLAPGGYLAIADFTVEEGQWDGAFWKSCFANDGVFLTTEHRAMLHSAEAFTKVSETVQRGGFPYVPLLSANCYAYVGQKDEE